MECPPIAIFNGLKSRGKIVTTMYERDSLGAEIAGNEAAWNLLHGCLLNDLNIEEHSATTPNRRRLSCLRLNLRESPLDFARA